jgi:hypothetical protein
MPKMSKMPKVPKVKKNRIQKTADRRQNENLRAHHENTKEMPKVKKGKQTRKIQSTKEEGESLFFLQSKIGNQKSKIKNLKSQAELAPTLTSDH